MSIKTWEERLEGMVHFDLQGYEEDRDDLKLEEIDELRAEVLRLADEVSNRNTRALEGDKAQAAFNLLYAEHKKLQGALRECRTLLGSPMLAFTTTHLVTHCEICPYKSNLLSGAKYCIAEERLGCSKELYLESLQRAKELYHENRNGFTSSCPHYTEAVNRVPD